MKIRACREKSGSCSFSSGLESGSKSIYEIAFLHGESMWAFTVVLFLTLFFLSPFPTFSFAGEVVFFPGRRERELPSPFFIWRCLGFKLLGYPLYLKGRWLIFVLLGISKVYISYKQLIYKRYDSYRISQSALSEAQENLVPF